MTCKEPAAIEGSLGLCGLLCKPSFPICHFFAFVILTGTSHNQVPTQAFPLAGTPVCLPGGRIFIENRQPCPSVLQQRGDFCCFSLWTNTAPHMCTYFLGLNGFVFPKDSIQRPGPWEVTKSRQRPYRWD